MPEATKPSTPHLLRLVIWALFVGAFIFLYYRYSSLWGTELTQIAATSVWIAYAVYVILGALRGFALIPVTNLVVLAIPIFPPLPLLILTLVGIAISSASIYAFAESLKLGQYLERKHAHHMERLQNALRRNPTSIVTAWSFLPIVPTDLICYVCGVMKISFKRFLLGVIIGEGAMCAIYIFGGNHLLDVGTRLFGADEAAGQPAAAVQSWGQTGLVLAHHSFSAEFDADKPVTLTGTVTSVEWRNPHVWFYIDVKHEDGSQSNWGFELASPNLLLRNGWTAASLKIGDVVKVDAYGAKNGSNLANAHGVTLTATGKILFTGTSSGKDL
jgi:uncharacterized membrane protein YdjX (TVP38/TMEM64 family)